MTEHDSIPVPQGKRVQANGLNIYYEEYGVGRPLLLLHGGGSTGRGSWSRVAPILAKHFRVITPDSRGHGSTNNPDGKLSPFDLSAARLGQISVPMLISVGDRDDDSPLEQAVAAFRLIPRGELAVAPHSTHMFPVGNPELMAHTMFKFFRRHTGEDAPT